MDRITKSLVCLFVAILLAACEDAIVEPTDGEGHAAVVSSRSVRAGELVQISIRFKAGSSGIPVGGGISVGFHHASSWWLQTSSPTKRHYATMESSTPANFDLKWLNNPPPGMLQYPDDSYNPDRMFHRVLIGKVVNQPIAPDSFVDIRLGANELNLKAQKFVDLDHEFRITTDIDGDGSYRGILNSPVISIVPAAADNLSAVAPSQATIDEAIDVYLRVEDEFYNLAVDHQALVDISDEHGLSLATDVPVVNGLGATRVVLTTPGAHRLRVTSAGGNLIGRSNPIRVFETQPVANLYWGDLHGHTGESDGLGRDAIEFFKFGRDVAKLDFVALTDHGQPAWAENKAAVDQFYQPGSYVTLLGFEGNTRRSPVDHTNVYYRANDADTLAGWWKTRFGGDGTANAVKGWKETNQDLMEALYEQSLDYELFSGPHHSGYDRGLRGDPEYPFHVWDDRIARFFEIYSSHGTSEFEGNPRPLAAQSPDADKYMQGGLAMGHKFSVIGASDNHDSKPGRSAWGKYPGGLSAVWANSLDRDSIWQSIFNFSTYGTSADRIYVDFDINGSTMGSTINNTGPLEINGYVIGKTDVVDVVLIKDNQVVQTYSTTNGLVEFTFTDVAGEGSHFYYLRVSQDNGERAWSTPIWVE